MARIYLSPPHVGPRERELLLDAFDSNWIAPLGPHVDAFEAELAAWAGVPHAAALSSGTAALHLGLEILGVGPGDVVLTSTLTFAATVNAIRYVGATPAFVDCTAATWQLDPQLLEEALVAYRSRDQRVGAVISVDLYGQCADYDAIEALCRQHQVPLVEDAAEALGATYKGRPAGSFGQLAAFSFNGNKIITTSGGGMLASHDPDIVARARFLATQARDPAAHYQHSVVGYNYRLSNLLAAVGRGQLEGLATKLERRRAVRQAYEAALAHLPGVNFMPVAAYGQPNHWLTCLTVDSEALGVDREHLRLALAAADIESRPVWKPMHLQPVFEQCAVVGGEVSASLFERGLCLPSGSSLSPEDQARVIDTFLGALP